MGSDGILVSQKKRLYCDIDRCYNFEDNRPGIWKDVKCFRESEPGISVQELIKIAEYNRDHPDEVLGRYNDYRTQKGLTFLRTLDKDDIIRLVPDDGMGDEYMDIHYGKGWDETEEDWVEMNDYSHSEYKEWDEYSIKQWKKEQNI